MNLKLGFDLNCFSNRYPEPERWTEFVASCGVKVVQFNFDIIDFLLPITIQDRLVRATLKQCERYGIRIKCAFGGHNHHQNYLGYPDDEVARAYETFYYKMARLTAALGGEGFGTCFAITTVHVQQNPSLRQSVLQRAIESYYRIAEEAKKLGLKYLLYEMTSIPRETCATFAENDFVLEQLTGCAVPVYPCLDVGHRNLENPQAPESDPYEWLKRYGSICPLIHIQQCNAEGSHHWAFIPKYNHRGDITPPKVIEAIRASGAKQEILLALEIRHRAYYPDEYQLEENLRESVRYWREWIPD